MKALNRKTAAAGAIATAIMVAFGASLVLSAAPAAAQGGISVPMSASPSPEPSDDGFSWG